MRTNTHPMDYQRRTPPRTAENDLQLESGMLSLRLYKLMGMQEASDWIETELAGLTDEQRITRKRGQIRYLEALHDGCNHFMPEQSCRFCDPVAIRGDDPNEIPF